MHFSTKILLFLLLTLLFANTISIASATESNQSLDTRQRAIIPIAAFTATGNIHELELALNNGMDEGLTINEVKEILVHTYAYAGFPRALNAINAYISVLDKRKAQSIVDRVGKAVTPMPSEFDKAAYGHQVRNALVGKDISNRTDGYPVFTPIIDQFLVEHLFADIFYRNILNYRDRELVTISMLAAMTGTEAQLLSHLRVSLNVGLTDAQLHDFVSLLSEEVSVASAQRASKALNKLTASKLAISSAKSVSVIKKQPPTRGSPNSFTGNVVVKSRFSSDPEHHYRGAIVDFEAGARTAWHKHPKGQTLIVISGKGLVQSDGDSVQTMLPGDVIWIPANVRHWHGASHESPVSHVAISTPDNGKTVEWMEHVSDEHYEN